MNNYYIVCLKLYDNEGQEIVLSRYNTHNVKYAYYNEDLEWVKSTDYNYEQQLNILWIRLPYASYQNKFLLNIAVDTEQVYTSGVIDVDWSNLPNPTPISLNMVATIDDNAQGFAPRIIKVGNTNYWFEYSQEYGGLYNTAIPVVNEIIAQGAVDIVSTDNSVSIEKTTDPTTSVLLYDLSVADAVKLDNLQMTTNEVLSGTGRDTYYLPQNSTVYIDADGTQTVKGKSTNTSRWVCDMDQDGWYRVIIFNGSGAFKIKRVVYNNKYQGNLYVVKNGYNYKAYTDNKELSEQIKIMQVGLSAYLMCQGNSHINSKIDVETADSCYFIGTKYSSYNFDPDRDLQDIPYFITNVDIASDRDYINITGKTYTQTLEELTITNYNFEQNLTYTLTDVPEEQLSLRFNATNDDTKVTIRVGDIESTSDTLQVGQSAIWTYYDEDNYGWTYTYIEDFNDLRYSSGTTDQGVTYQHIIRLGDKKVVFDLLDFNTNWTIINNNYNTLSTSVENLWTTITTINGLLYKHGVQDTNPDDPLDYRYVSAVTINNETHYPINSVVDLGEIGGGGEGSGDCEYWTAIIDFDKVDLTNNSEDNPLDINFKTYNLALPYKVLFKGKLGNEVSKNVYINFVADWTGSIGSVGMYIYNEARYLNNLYIYPTWNDVKPTDVTFIHLYSCNVYRYLVNSTDVSQSISLQRASPASTSLYAPFQAFDYASINNNKLRLVSIFGSATELELPSVSSVTLNGSAHTVSNGAVDLGSVKVKTGTNTFTADTDNLVDIGTFSRPSNARLKTASSGYIKLSGNNSWFDATIRLYDATLRFCSYQATGGIRILYTDSGNRMTAYQTIADSQDLYLYYGGNVQYYLKVNQGTIKVTDTDGVEHTIHEYDEESANQINIRLEQNVDTNNLFQIVGTANQANFENSVITLTQKQMDYYGYYASVSSTDVIINLPKPSCFRNNFTRKLKLSNNSNTDSVRWTIKDHNGVVLKMIDVPADKACFSTLEFIGNYNQELLSGWKVDTNILPKATRLYNATLSGNSSVKRVRFDLSANAEVEFYHSGHKVVASSDATYAYITSESVGNKKLVVELSEQTDDQRALQVEYSGDTLQMKVVKGTVILKNANNNNVIVSSTDNLSINPATNTDYANWQLVAGEDANYTTVIDNKHHKYCRTGGSLSSVNVYVSDPNCKRVPIHNIQSFYTTSTGTSWSAFLFGKDSSGNSYQIMPSHSLNSTYGKEFSVHIVWDPTLSKWRLA